MIGKVCSVGLLGVGMALGQAPAAATAGTATAPAKTLAFDVVSIRQDTTPMGPQNGPPQFGPTPDGYHATNLPLVLIIMTAYPPQSGGGDMLTPDRITGLPDWAMRDRYDINAKVAEEDLAEWQKPASQTAMLQTMLQAFLADRCKIQVHRDNKESQVYLMTVGKSGPKFKVADPTADHPPGMTLPGGATVVPSANSGIAVYGTTMPMLATLLSSMGKGPMGGGGRQIQDKTGLTGKYDLVIPRPDMGPPPGGPGGSSGFDPTEMMLSTADALGLKLEPAKASVETLVIDHIEKPSQN